MHQLKAPAGSFTTVWAGLRVQTTRYAAILRKRWWLIVLTASLGLCAAAWYVLQQPPAYLSLGRLMVSGQIHLTEGAQYSEELFNFFGTQVELMQSGEVRQRAHERVAALYPELPMEEVRLQVTQVPRASIFAMRCVGKSAKYTQAYLDASMDEYISAKKQMRDQKVGGTTTAIADELVQLEREMGKDDDSLHEFQKQFNVGFLREEGNSAGLYLAQLNRQMADLQTEMDLLGLLDLEQNLQRQQVTAAAGDRGTSKTENALPNFGPMADYQKAKQSIEELNAEAADLGRYLRPKHPKMVVLMDKVTKAEDLLKIYKAQSAEALQTRRESIRLQIENLKTVIKQWEEKALDLSRHIADFDKIKSKSERTRAQYDRLTASLHSVDVTKRVDQDMISVLEHASPAISTRPGLEIILAAGIGLGMLLGLAILFVLDKLDDRIGSFIEFRSHFAENLLGQIPREAAPDGLQLLGPSDVRHSLVESFRTLRSSIIFLPVEKARPKTLLITSATPGEGKTTIASNLAISFAFSGAKTLLIDCDLRRGRLRELFQAPENGGFSKVLQQRCTWQEVVIPTSTPNLSLITRGKSLAHPGEHLLGKVTDQFLQDVYSQFDYIIFDSAPVMAADDTLSLAPKIDGVIFTIRFSTSSARISRKALELLEQRQINILGLVANDVKLSEAGYGYGYYYDYRQPEPQELGVGA